MAIPIFKRREIVRLLCVDSNLSNRQIAGMLNVASGSVNKIASQLPTLGLSWEQLKGQEQAAARLRQELLQHRVAHAYLFEGPPGVGKEAAALNFATALNCLAQDGDACGRCSSCLKAAAGNHPEIQVVSPQGNSFKIKQVREMQEALGYALPEGLHRVVLVREAETLTPEAANALLKTLEEPPSRTVFILIASRPEMLPATVLSRCRRLSFQPLPEALLKEVLLGEGYSGAALEFAVRLAGGSLAKARDLAGGGEATACRDQAGKYLENLLGAETREALALAGELGQRADRETLLWWLVAWYRDFLVWRETGEEKLILNKNCLDLVKKLAGKADAARGLAELLKTLALLKQNVNARLAMEVLCLRLAGKDAGLGEEVSSW